MDFATRSYSVPSREQISRTNTHVETRLYRAWFNYTHDRLGFFSKLRSVFSARPARLSLGDFMPCTLTFNGVCSSCNLAFRRQSIISHKFSFDNGFMFGQHNHHCSCDALLMSLSFVETPDGVLMPRLHESHDCHYFYFSKDKP